MSRAEPQPNPPEGSSTAYSVAFVLALLIVLGGAVGQVLDQQTAEAAQPAAAARWRPGQAHPTAVSSLTCFTCHSLETYAQGGEGRFPHTDHFDFLEVQGCHLCHAFAGHDVVINRAPCADCH